MTTATPEIEIHLEEQARLVCEIIDMMAGITVQPAITAWPPQADMICASVAFDGAWTGAMRFECTLPLAFAFTARFMSVPTPAGVNEDVRDSLGELANMIAGNFKALLPAGSMLSIPEVHAREGSLPLAKNSRPLCQSVFQTGFGTCCLVLESRTRQA